MIDAKDSKDRANEQTSKRADDDEATKDTECDARHSLSTIHRAIDDETMAAT